MALEFLLAQGNPESLDHIFATLLFSMTFRLTWKAIRRASPATSSRLEPAGMRCSMEAWTFAATCARPWRF
jgi:hypothetical protein